MKRAEQAKHNKLVIDKIAHVVGYSYRIPSYKRVCETLEKHELISSVGKKCLQNVTKKRLQWTMGTP